MSCGERSCINFGNCKLHKDISDPYDRSELCHIECEGYKWDNKTKPDTTGSFQTMMNKFLDEAPEER